MVNTVTATAARNDFFKLIERVSKEKKPVKITKDGKTIVEITPSKEDPQKEWEETKKLLTAVRGMWADRTEEEIRGPFREAARLTMKKIRARDKEYAKSRFR